MLLPAQCYVHTERTGAVLLLLAAPVALGWANSPWQSVYAALVEQRAPLDLGGLSVSEDLRHWVNDGLMVVLFYVVGLEIKREVLDGKLADRSRDHPAGARCVLACGSLQTCWVGRCA